MHDDQLLNRYARDGSEAAFGQLVSRHLTLVYSTCMREVGSPALAEDAAQVVFLLLARKANSLHAGPSLAGWLYKAARFVARDVRKQEARRQRREQAVRQETAYRQEASASEWGLIEPLLNDALSALKPGEREAVLLRFVEGHSLAETGAALGVSEDAARMRVARAVEKMRQCLAARGAVVSGAILAGLLASEAAWPAPADATALTQGTLQTLSAGPRANVLLLSKGVSQTMKIIKVKFAVLAAALILAGSALPPLAHALTYSEHVRKASVTRSTVGHTLNRFDSRPQVPAVQLSQAPVSQQKGFLLGLTLFDCDERARYYLLETAAISTSSDTEEKNMETQFMSWRTGKVRRTQAAAYSQVAALLQDLGAPSSLRLWYSTASSRLMSPLLVSQKIKAEARAELATSAFASITDKRLAATEAQRETTLAGLAQMAALKDEERRSRSALTAWLENESTDLSRSCDLGALAAHMDWTHWRPEDPPQIDIVYNKAVELSQNAPASTPAQVQQDLAALRADTPRTRLLGHLDSVRGEMFKTYNVKPSQVFPL